MLPTVETVRDALAVIETHADKWPTPDELRANARGHSPASARVVPPPGQLPFGLDRVTDTPARTRTRDGAAQVLAGVLTEWGHHLDAQATMRDYETRARALIELLPRAWQDLPTQAWEATANALIRLAADTRTQCATGGLGTSITCPSCVTTTLVRPYTDAGISESFRCDTCGGTWQAADLHTLALAHSAYVSTIVVTRAQAAEILDITWEGVQARIKRRALAPVEGQGRGAKYRLRDLQ